MNISKQLNKDNKAKHIEANLYNYIIYKSVGVGVPPGSVLSPFYNCVSVDVKLYADDTVVYTHEQTAERAALKLQLL